MGILAACKDLLVVNAAGNVDLDSTVNAIKVALVKEIEASAAMDAKISKALDEVYDRLNTDIFATPSVVAMAAALLVGNDIGQIAKVSEQVHEYIDRSPRFKGERGRKGGLKRLSK